MSAQSYLIKGHLIYNKTMQDFDIVEDGYLHIKDGFIEAIYHSFPEQLKDQINSKDIQLIDYGNRLIIPGMTDLHLHAPQYTYTALGMDMELLEWLETNTFPEEAKYKDLNYANKAYSIFTKDLRYSTTTRGCIFATVHKDATLLLMDMLESSGLCTMVGKVNMDRNAPDYLKEVSAEDSAYDTVEWIKDVLHKKYKNTLPILTPRFTPSCTDALMEQLKMIQMRYDLPLQSHLSENLSEIAWVKELCPWSEFYGDAYDHFGLFGVDCPTVMAHCVYSSEEELLRIKENGVFIAHCPTSNTNIASGIAPIRKYINMELNVGLGSDVAGGDQLNMLKAIAHAIQVSKLRWRLVNTDEQPLTVEEAFFLATKGGGAFFGKVGSLEPGYEADFIVLDDNRLYSPKELNIHQRLERIIYLGDDREIYSKYVRGIQLF